MSQPEAQAQEKPSKTNENLITPTRDDGELIGTNSHKNPVRKIENPQTKPNPGDRGDSL